MYKLGFIGAGNMGSALAIAAGKTLGGENVLIYDRDIKKSLNLSDKYGFAIAKDEKEVADGCRFILLAVKPNIIRGVAESIKSQLEKGGHTVVTIAAGVPISAIKLAINEACPVIRIMPNTPVAVGKGTILITWKEEVKDETAAEFMDIMKAAGSFEKMPEEQFDITTAISSCSPAYAYMFIEAMADGAVYCGVPRDRAIRLAAQTVLGSCQMILESGENPEKLKDNVCSPAGSTIAGVEALEKNGFRYASSQAIIKATEKNLSLGK